MVELAADCSLGAAASGFEHRVEKAMTEVRRVRLAVASLATVLFFTTVGNGISGRQGWAIAQSDSVRSPLSNLEAFPLFPTLSTEPYQGQIVASDSSLSPTQMEQPSLSWIEDQIGNRYGSDRLVERWRAYRAPDRLGETISYVDVIVNESIWDLLNYFERYAFISQFGSAAKSQGYNLRVFHTGDEQTSLDAGGSNIIGVRTAVLRGAYFCNFEQANSLSDSNTRLDTARLPCDIVLDEASLRTRESILSP